MPIDLSNLPEDVFPPLHMANSYGFLAYGGRLSVERLKAAYRQGVFPWYSEDPPKWFSPDPRFLIVPDNFKFSKSMRSVLRKEAFRVTLNQAFDEVIINCKDIEREDQDGTWITDEVLEGYRGLHKAGFSHSVEVWQDDILVGGLYGQNIGRCFCGESMFAKVSGASKVGFIAFCRNFFRFDGTLIDCQTYTPHLASFGALPYTRSAFKQELDRQNQIEEAGEGIDMKSFSDNFITDPEFLIFGEL